MLLSLFGSILTTSASMSLFLLVALAASPKLNRRFHVQWKYWLWLAAALRMLLPVRLSMPGMSCTVEVPSHIVPAGQIPQGILLSSPTQAAAAPFYSVNLLYLPALIWLTGLLFTVSFHFLAYRHGKRNLLRWSIRCADGALLALAEQLKAEMKLRRLPEIYICQSVSSPVLLGFFRYRLLLPGTGYGKSETEYILRHELVHLKRKDTWYKLALTAVTAIHWFNPASHLLLREAGRDLELLCDDAVVAGLEARARLEYCQTILTAAKTGQCHMTVLSTGFRGGAISLRSRLQNLLTGRRPKGTAVYLIGLATLLLTSSLIGFLPIEAAATVQVTDASLLIPGGVRGIDVSAYQGTIDWQKVARDDIHFTYIRASNGLSADPAFSQNLTGAHAAGIETGAWHYAAFHDHASMRREADFFLEILENTGITLPAALCVGTPPPTGMNKQAWTSLCLEFLGTVEAAGYPVMLNTNSSYLSAHLDESLLSGTSKWIMNYTAEPEGEHQFWQYTGSGTVAGIDGPVDINVAYAAPYFQ